MTEERRPRESSYSPSPPRRGGEASGYTTERVSPRGRSSSGDAGPWNTRGRSQSTTSRSPPPRVRSPNPFDRFRDAGQGNAHRSPSPAARSRRRSSSTRRPTYAYGRTPRRSPSPVHHEKKHRAASPPRSRNGNTKNSYGTTWSSRHRSPSPKKKWNRSPSPPLRQTSSHQSRKKSSPWDFSQKYRTETRTPNESTSSKQPRSQRESSRHRSSTRDRPLPRDGSHGRPNTSSKPSRSDNWRQNERERSPSPRARPHRYAESESPQSGYRTEELRPECSDSGYNSRDQCSRSNTRSDAPRYQSPRSASTYSKPAPALTELKKLFDAYNARWENLSRIDKKLPLPASWSDLKKIDYMGGNSNNEGNWSDEAIIVANIQIIFLAGFGISGSVRRTQEGLVIDIDGNGQHVDKLRELSKWLSRKEQPRWHPDRINLRTGQEGVVDEEMSKKTAVVAMRSAVQALLEVIA